MSLPVGVIGGGGFGRGLARAAARVGRHVILWSRQARELDDSKIRFTKNLEDLAEAELLFVAVPSARVEEVASEVGRHLGGGHLLVHVSRGLLGDELGTITQLLRKVTPVRRVGVLAGPLVAKSLDAGEPGGGIVGSLFPEVADAVSDAIGGPRLRIYRTTDVIGVEFASAMVGLMALAVGYAQGLGLGPGTLAVLSTRGIFESARVGMAHGGEERTFSGLAGFGDLTAAVAGDRRPEVEFGRALSSGVPLSEAARQAGANVEGATIARRVATYAHRKSTSAPISRAMARLIDGETKGQQVVEELMARPSGKGE